MIFRSPFPDVEIPEVPLSEFVLGAAAGLARRGFAKGDVLALYSPNLPEYVIAFHAVATLGGIVTTVNPLYTVEELSKQLADSGAKYLVTIPPLLERAREAAEGKGLSELFVFGEAEGATPFASLLEGGAD